MSRRDQLIAEIEAVEARLARLAAEEVERRSQLATLRAELASIDATQTRIRVSLPPSRPLPTPATPEQKVALFRQIFSGRQDVFPTRFRRWQALSVRSPREVPMRFLRQGDAQFQLRRMLDSGRACLALFAAADELRLGFVRGVPPYIYVQRIQPANIAAWKNLRPCSPGEPPDVIVRQAPAAQSAFRGIVRPEGLAACDVLQVWVDVASHPSRGREQADLIRKRVLQRLIEGGDSEN